MRRLTVPTSAVCGALILSACGGSSRHGPTRTTHGPTRTAHGPTRTAPAPTGTLPTRTTPPPPTSVQIERAATLTAAEPGFAAKISASVNLPQLSGNAVTAIGDGHFDPRSRSGTLDVVVGLPGLLGLAGPLPAQVRLVGGQAYVQVSSDVASAAGISPGWLQDSIAALGLGDSLSPPDILREVARDATQTVPRQRASVTIDPGTGLVRTILVSYAVAGGYRVHVRLTLTGFGAHAATSAPAHADELQPALQALGF